MIRWFISSAFQTVLDTDPMAPLLTALLTDFSSEFGSPLLTIIVANV